MEDENNEQEDGLNKYYKFESEDEKEAYLFQRGEYFEKVSSSLAKAVSARAKLDNIQAALRVKVQQLEAQIKKQAKENLQKQNQENFQKNKEGKNTKNLQNHGEEDLLKQDLVFCKEALVEGNGVAARMDSGRSTLEAILATREKKAYRVITDIALVPLPSERAKNKSKDKDKNKDAEKNKSQSGRKNANRKLSAADLKKLRNGQSLDSVPEPKSAPKTHAPNQNINLTGLSRQSGGYGY